MGGETVVIKSITWGIERPAWESSILILDKSLNFFGLSVLIYKTEITSLMRGLEGFHDHVAKAQNRVWHKVKAQNMVVIIIIIITVLFF